MPSKRSVSDSNIVRRGYRSATAPPAAAAATLAGVRIDIWSDVICPWCYLGHRRFAAALGELPAGRIEVRWRAFELDPRAPAEPQELRPVLERKYGPGAFDAMTTRLTGLGAAEGIDYRFDLAQRVNTFDAHRLISWAGTAHPTVQDRLVERCFRAYFSEGADVSDRSTLAGLATDVGLDRDEAVGVLDDGAFGEAVRSDESEAAAHAITGVPAFVIDGELLIPGAQDTATFVRLLGRALERSPG
jgi:predicted DsbA family dithiol-disulfide isomerase